MRWTATSCSTTRPRCRWRRRPDVHVELPALWLIVLAVVAAIAAWANVRLRTIRLLIAAPLLVFGGSFLFAELIPGLFERFFVKPNELQLETPYIRQNIAFTREAYNLDQIAVKPFPAEQDLTFQSLKDNSGTIDNIRLWDWQPLMDTYANCRRSVPTTGSSTSTSIATISAIPISR